MQIDDYLDAAKEVNNFKSDRKLCEAIGLKPTAITQWRTRRAWPTDTAMIRISELANVDPAEGLIDLNIWRSDGEASSIYTRMRKALHVAVIFLVFAIAGQAAIPRDATAATSPAVQHESPRLYIMEN